MKTLKGKIERKVRSSKFFHKAYYYLGSLFLNFLKIFVRKQENLILFVSFGGKHYNDSPRAIYEGMINDKRFINYDIVWAFKDPDNIKLPGNHKKINIDSIQYFLISLKASVWISNTPIERRLNYKGKHTYYFGTWHGTPIKKLGKDVSEVYGLCEYDVLCAQGQFDVEIWQEAFNIDKEKILCCGLPRNDALARADTEEQLRIKEELKLPHDKKIILYCPTFRDWQTNYMSSGIDIEKWRSILGDDYIILYRAHSMVKESINIKNDAKFVYDMSNYDDLNDLMIASDLLISDYSSTFFDYSILNKPMFCYTYDFDEYVEKRGVYFDIRKELPGGSISEEALLNLVLEFPDEDAVKIVKEFRNKYIDWYGNATNKALDNIYSRITT